MSKKEESKLIVPDEVNQLPVSIDDTASIVDYFKKELEKLNEIELQSNKTDGKFYFNPHNKEERPSVGCYKIHMIRNNEVLDQIGSFLYGKEQEWNGYQIDVINEGNLNAEYPAMMWLGYTFDDWMSDIKKRKALNSQQEAKQYYEKAISEFSEFLTERDKKQSLFNKYFKKS